LRSVAGFGDANPRLAPRAVALLLAAPVVVQRQLTNAAHGHILANAAVWSPDGAWLVYDTRSDPAGSAFDGTRIERVNVHTGEVQLLYESRRGACCGVPMVNPVDGRIAFILGPEDPTPDWQYCAWHRQGVLIDPERPGELTNLDARNLTPPFTPGALRGGSHVHQFSPDGRLVSFTYEDHALATVAASLRDAEARFGETRLQQVDPNQRNVAVAFPPSVQVPRTHPRNHDGEFFSVVVTRTVNAPRPGSDEISRAYEEAWIATPQRAGASPPPAGVARSLAFLGDVVASDGTTHAELFVVELSADLSQPGDGPLEGTPTRRPAPPAGTRQRRLTFAGDRPVPGLRGPRFWPRSAPDGNLIAVLMPDNARHAQLWAISPQGGELRQLTRDPFPVTSAFTWNHDGSRIAYIADGSVMTVDVDSGRTRRLTPSASGLRPEACVFSPDGRRIAFVRTSVSASGEFNQVCIASSIDNETRA
jgi:hypothetical protein